jgi:hypothetical protein
VKRDSREGDHVMSGSVWFVAPLMLVAATVSVAAEQKDKPVCDARSRGTLWPENTTRGAGVPVEICAMKGWHYRWQQLTVDVSQLKAAVKRKQVVAAMPARRVSGAR